MSTKMFLSLALLLVSSPDIFCPLFPDAQVHVDRIMETNDYYKILDLKTGATCSDAKKAYFKIVIYIHPDKTNNDKEAEVAFQRASQAYQCLSNQDRKQRYDNSSPAEREADFGSTTQGFDKDAPSGSSKIYLTDVFDKKFPLIAAVPLVLCNIGILCGKCKDGALFLIQKIRGRRREN